MIIPHVGNPEMNEGLHMMQLYEPLAVSILFFFSNVKFLMFEFSIA